LNENKTKIANLINEKNILTFLRSFHFLKCFCVVFVVTDDGNASILNSRMIKEMVYGSKISPMKN